jgi:chloramphenicol 3-O-phosphotransferase
MAEFGAIFLNGTVGAGKTTLADAIGSLERRPNAVIDLDEIRRLRPSPPTDPFNHELELQNLRSLVTNYRRFGAERFILAGVIEHASEVSRYVDALGGGGMYICRLVARPDVIADRLTRRHAAEADERDWHLARHPVLARILADAAIEHLTLDTSESTPLELAERVRAAAGWGPEQGA